MSSTVTSPSLFTSGLPGQTTTSSAHGADRWPARAGVVGLEPDAQGVRPAAHAPWTPGGSHRAARPASVGGLQSAAGVGGTAGVLAGSRNPVPVSAERQVSAAGGGFGRKMPKAHPLSGQSPSGGGFALARPLQTMLGAFCRTLAFLYRMHRGHFT
jgi:hypothetical protein